MKKILLVISANEHEHFFPEDLETQIKAMPGEWFWVDSTDGDAYTRALTEFSPQIILGAWDMPPMPLEALVSKGGSVEYFCFLCGSAKNQISGEHLDEGLILTTWGSWVGPYVAECALMLVLNALRRTARWGHQLKAEGKWRDRTTNNRSLYGKRVSIHGFGGVARALTRLLRPFNPVVTTWDPFVGDNVLADYGVTRATSVEALFAEADVFVELLPLTPETEGCVNEELLRSLPKGACFINIGRGVVIDEEALIRVASEGGIEVALDVYAQEPLPIDSPLRALPNVFLSPHLGGATIDRGIDCGQRALHNVERYLAGEALENRVDSEAFARAT